MPTRKSHGPISDPDRIAEIDALRGWAILGMVLVNAGTLSGYWLFPEQWTSIADKVAIQFVTIFVEDKFFTLFAYLFGLGFAIQMNRASACGREFIRIYVRRLTVLLIIGILTLVFIAPVFILQTYALLGFSLLLFRDWQARNLLIFAFICLLIPFANEAVKVTHESGSIAQSQPEQLHTLEVDGSKVKQTSSPLEARSIHQEGTYLELLSWRVRLAWKRYTKVDHFIVNMLGNTLPIFLLGLWTGKRRIFENLGTQMPLVHRVFWWGLAIGLAGTLISVAIDEWLNLGRPQLTEPLAILLWNIGRPGLCFFYATGLILIMQQRFWRRLLAPICAVGRLALSNYLLHLIVFAIIFPAYGFGLFGKIGPAALIALAVLVYAGLAIWSVWWVRCYRYGPAEWVWRSLTYGRRQPIVALLVAGGIRSVR